MAKAGKKTVKKRASSRRLTTCSAPLVRVAPADRLLSDLRTLIETARKQVARTVNSALAGLYWHIGKRIREDVLNEQRAEYGEQIVSSVMRQMSWTHPIDIFPLENPLKRDFYAEMCRIERWSSRTGWRQDRCGSRLNPAVHFVL